MVLEIQMNSIDRGADLSKLSQYPHEAEICFAPCAALQVEDTDGPTARSDGAVVDTEGMDEVDATIAELLA